MRSLQDWMKYVDSQARAAGDSKQPGAKPAEGTKPPQPQEPASRAAEPPASPSAPTQAPVNKPPMARQAVPAEPDRSAQSPTQRPDPQARRASTVDPRSLVVAPPGVASRPAAAPPTPPVAREGAPTAIPERGTSTAPSREDGAVAVQTGASSPSYPGMTPRLRNEPISTGLPAAAERGVRDPVSRGVVDSPDILPRQRQTREAGPESDATGPAAGPQMRVADSRSATPEGDGGPTAAELWNRLPKHLQYLVSQEKPEVASRYYQTFKEDRAHLLQRLLDPEISLEEAARVLGVCPTTVRRYTNKGALRHHRTAGNQRRFRLSDVLAFLEKHGG